MRWAKTGGLSGLVGYIHNPTLNHLTALPPCGLNHKLNHIKPVNHIPLFWSKISRFLNMIFIPYFHSHDDTKTRNPLDQNILQSNHQKPHHKTRPHPHPITRIHPLPSHLRPRHRYLLLLHIHPRQTPYNRPRSTDRPFQPQRYNQPISPCIPRPKAMDVPVNQVPLLTITPITITMARNTTKQIAWLAIFAITIIEVFALTVISCNGKDAPGAPERPFQSQNGKSTFRDRGHAFQSAENFGHYANSQIGTNYKLIPRLRLNDHLSVTPNYIWQTPYRPNAILHNMYYLTISTHISFGIITATKHRQPAFILSFPNWEYVPIWDKVPNWILMTKEQVFAKANTCVKSVISAFSLQ